jgi:hypothetical protein
MPHWRAFRSNVVGGA